MNHVVRLLVTLFLLVPVLAPAADKPQADEKLSYAIGVLFARNMALEVDVNTDQFLAGLRDVLTGAELKYTAEELQQIVTAFQQQQASRQGEAAQGNKAAGEAFLTANGRKPGVVTLPSGLQYKVVTQGKGAKPAATSTVTVHYRGTLIDGTEFDSSYKRGEPTTFPLNGVIKGWQEGVGLMTEGSKYELYLPPQLAYGENGAGGVIGPNATLVFEVELLTVK